MGRINKAKRIWSKCLAVLLVCTLIHIPQLTGLVDAPYTAYADEPTYGTPDHDKPTPVNIKNGSFEDPAIANYYSSLPCADVPGWNSLALNTLAADRIEIQKDRDHQTVNSNFAKTAVDGIQYVECNAETPTYLYQELATKPGSRLYYTYYHKAYGNESFPEDDLDIMNFYILDTTGGNRDLDQDPIRVSSDSPKEWVRYSGRYTVPTGQTQSEFGFKSVESYTHNPTAGNFIDAVSVVTGSFLEIDESVSSDVNAKIAQIGDTLTYTAKITNYGEMDAKAIVFTNYMNPEDLEYVGNVTIDGVAATATYSAGAMNVDIDSIKGITNANPGGTEGQTITVTWQAKIKNFSAAGLTEKRIKNQSSVEYTDEEYPQVTYNSERYDNYSDIATTIVIKPIATTSVAVYKVWAGDTDYNRPESVDIVLKKNGEDFKTATLNEDNDWHVQWDDLEDEIVDATSPGGEALSLSESTPSDATSSEADEDGALYDGVVGMDLTEGLSDPSYITWTVEETTRLGVGYATPVVQKADDSNVFTVTNTYTKQSDSDGGTGSTGGSSPDKKSGIKLNKVCTSGGVTDDGTIDYRLTITNDNDTPAIGVFIVDFLPKHTELISSGSDGEYYQYGDTDTLTWFIPSLDAKSSQTMNLTVRLTDLPEEGEAIANTAHYVITGSTAYPDNIDEIIEGMTHESADATEIITFTFNEAMTEWLQQMGGSLYDANRGIIGYDENGNPIYGFKALPKTGDKRNQTYPYIILALIAICGMLLVRKQKR